MKEERQAMAPYEDTRASSAQKEIPQNIEAEKSVLAACMLSQNALDEIATRLVPENFFRPAHH